MNTKRILGVGLLASATAFGAMALTGGAEADAQTIQVTTMRQSGGQRYHVARSGDTLYDLAGQFYGDPMQWPRLWSYNPQITNPHWIYPGDVIFLRPPAEPDEIEQDMYSGLYFPLAGFYTSSEFSQVGELRFARTDRRLLATHDEVYLAFDEPENVRIGDEYVINAVTGRLYDDDDELVGVKYIVTGRVQVRAEHEETDLFTAEIVQLWDVIERGDVLFVNAPQLLVVEPRENTVDLEAEIIDHLDPIQHMHEQHYVFLDVGYSDGVRSGNRFFIWGREDEGSRISSIRERRVDYEEDIVPQLPWQLYGEAMVIYTSQEYSTAVIVNAHNHEIVDGQRVTLQRGY